MKMYLYKVVARFGLDSELDCILHWKLSSAIETALIWLEQNEDCDSVTIYYEETDKDGAYHTKGIARTIEREGE